MLLLLRGDEAVFLVLGERFEWGEDTDRAAPSAAGGAAADEGLRLIFVRLIFGLDRARAAASWTLCRAFFFFFAATAAGAVLRLTRLRTIGKTSNYLCQRRRPVGKPDGSGGARQPELQGAVVLEHK